MACGSCLRIMRSWSSKQYYVKASQLIVENCDAFCLYKRNGLLYSIDTIYDTKYNKKESRRRGE